MSSELGGVDEAPFAAQRMAHPLIVENLVFQRCTHDDMWLLLKCSMEFRLHS